ncbi:class II fumarate hydratase [Amphritea sp. 1_MG-2023]|uniref:class II fumarate hydratase n=1 Tax=Amphritea sp. 1_MG-2023 TaxID=3062670 RepID=UPI0026E1D50F|nr:class II fumarate hydratase [Amphritea sp. 1_MG-2023]MDO6563076.1 class II fumarate hydratase [Amphritea sp. 1_MG-2023]
MKTERKHTKGSHKQEKISDHFAPIEVEPGALWGTQTQRSLINFNIGKQCFEADFIIALVAIKRACAVVNQTQGHLSEEHYRAIIQACDTLLQGEHRDQFPLRVWQTGSGTQTNMNVNEVICTLANRFQEKAQPANATVQAIHANDHVNMSQSSNDVFPTAMHLVVAQQSHTQLLPAIDCLMNMLRDKQRQFADRYTVGRTHMMDALPLTGGAILSAYISQLAEAQAALSVSLDAVYKLAIGGTAVGSGSNAPAGFGVQVAEVLSQHYRLPFVSHENLYAAVSGEDASLRFSGGLKQLAAVLLKLANDFRLLASGPRCGLNEWQLPANEPGSSIMPGKVNPTQCEALSMVCLQVFGNDVTVSMAASQGQLQLNTYRPVIIHNLMESMQLLTDAMQSFAHHCVAGLTLNTPQIEQHMADNLSVITLLAPQLGYDVASAIVHQAHQDNCSLAVAAETLGYYPQAEFTALMQAVLTRQLSRSTGE